MPSSRVTYRERGWLKKLAERPRMAHEIPDEHLTKFVDRGLVEKDLVLMRLTGRGQLELYRNRFRKASSPPAGKGGHALLEVFGANGAIGAHDSKTNGKLLTNLRQRLLNWTQKTETAE